MYIQLVSQTLRIDSFTFQVKVLYVRNFKISTPPETIQTVFENAINKKIERVKKIYDYSFVHFYEREHAELAMTKLNNTEVDGSHIEIRWAKPVDRELYKLQKLNKGNAKFNNSLDWTQTLLLYNQHWERKEYASTPKEDEGFGSACAGESSCGSPPNMKDSRVLQHPFTPSNYYSIAPAKLDAMCKRYFLIINFLICFSFCNPASTGNSRVLFSCRLF